MLGAALLSATACARPAMPPVLYDWFAYDGHDAEFSPPLPPGDYRNPVLAGFHPDPSVVRVGDRFYLINSSFAYFPGIPVFESRDLVHWRQIGDVIDRPSELPYDRLGVSQGVFAPDISYHDGTFYVVNTFVGGGHGAGGSYVVTAKDPAGPWSDPVWLPSVDGIDPSLFFDADGKAYLLYSGEPPGGPRYAGQRALWLQRFDPATLRLVGPRKMVLYGGVDPATRPIWAEGPHLFRHAGWYFLAFAQGGTALQHSEMVLRSRSPWGPFQADPHNPILTQRDLPAGRAQPVINAGHADLVEAADGSWWAVFLASRAYGGVHYNTGRETFLLKVHWKDGWPMILPHGAPVPFIAAGPAFMESGVTQAPLSANFEWRDDFAERRLRRTWLYLRAPEAWASLAVRPGWLAIRPLAAGLDSKHNPSFLARRQQHLAFTASTAFLPPAQPGVDAGIALFQNDSHWYFLGSRRSGDALELFLEEDAGGPPRVIARARLAPPRGELRLKIAGDRGSVAFAYATGQGNWRWLKRGADATILSTDVAGGFVGAVVGPYARLSPTGDHD